MSQLQQLQGPIDQAIFAEVLACIPKDWVKVRLDATVLSEGPGGTKMSIRLEALGQTGIGIVSDELQDKVRELFLVNAKFNTELQGIHYEYALDASDGRWTFDGEYDYP